MTHTTHAVSPHKMGQTLASIAALIAIAGVDAASAASPTTAPANDPVAGPLQFNVNDIDGKDVNLAEHKGKVVVIVNVASKCGHTKQYASLEAMYRKYKERGLVVLGFPANNFGGQEPGTEAEIKEFCTGKYDVTFPMMSKISVKGADKHPLYKYLTEKPTAGDHTGEIGWNFTKFVIGRDGQIAERFASQIQPTDPAFIAAVEKQLDSATP